MILVGYVNMQQCICKYGYANYISPHQYGFIKETFTEDARINVINKIYLNLKKIRK